MLFKTEGTIEEFGLPFAPLLVSTYLNIIRIIHNHVQKPYCPEFESIAILLLQIHECID
jgi:hypothetical protein